MSVFTFFGGAVDPIVQRITGSTATIIIDATTTGPLFVSWFAVNENSGATPSLTVDIYDGTTAIYLGAGGSAWKAKALTAGQSVVFDAGYAIPLGSTLRVTSSDAAGKMDVVGVALLPAFYS